MVREEKKEEVKQLAEKLSRSSIALAADYRGLTATTLNQLRRQLREQGLEFRVVKNTLALRAAQAAGKAPLSPLLTGPTALVIGYGEPNLPSKSLQAFSRAAGLPLLIKGALLGQRLLDPREAASLGSLPPRESLLAEVVGALAGPLAALVQTLSAPLQGLLLTLQARQQAQAGQQKQE